METTTNYGCLKPKQITEMKTQIGYLQVLEYILQNKDFLHIVEWYYNNDLEKNTNIPKIYCDSFYKEKNEALKLAQYIGNVLLEQY